MRRLAMLWSLWAVGALGGCATAGGGSFAITGEKVMDECPKTGIYLAAKHVFVDPAGGTLYADVVNRVYSLRVHGDELEASGRFPATYCPSGRLDERWRLHGTHHLEGTLESTWPTPGDCSATCTVRFDIHGTRLRPGQVVAAHPVASRKAVPAAERDVPLDLRHMRMVFGSPYCAVARNGTLAFCGTPTLEECQRSLDASPAGPFKDDHTCAARPDRIACFAYTTEGRTNPGWHCTASAAACEQDRLSFRDDLSSVTAVGPCTEVALP